MNTILSTAATQATRALLKYKVSRTPIYPQQIIQESEVATMISFADLAELANVERSSILSAVHHDNDMVISAVYNMPDGKTHHLFAFNREKPIGKIRYALAFELGHVFMGHVGYRCDETRKAESSCFANHFVFPRAMIRLLQERNFVLTEENFARIFGESHWYLPDLVNTEHVISVPAELNRQLKEQFTPYVDALEAAGIFAFPVDPSDPVLDFSRYMEGYEE